MTSQESIDKAIGQFNLRLPAIFTPLEMYGQKPYVEQAIIALKLLNSIACYEAGGIEIPLDLVHKLNEQYRAAQNNGWN